MTALGPPRDPEYTVERIDEVKDGGEYWSIHFVEGFCFSIPKAQHPEEPALGSPVRLYGQGFGRPVRGVEIGDRTVYYRTQEEEAERHRNWVAEQKAARKDHYETHREDYTRRVAALPGPFQKRIARFTRNQPEFPWEYLPYELSACEDAVKIAAALKTSDAIIAFQKEPYERQRELVPGLFDGHSGNTFGWAVRLAHHYVTNPDLVWADHAAISSLVGCDDAGCPPLKGDEIPESLR
jgi:hypothetical protein